MINKHFRIETYENLKKNFKNLNSWKKGDFLDYSLSSAEQYQLQEIKAAEIIFPGSQGKNSDTFFEKVNFFLKKYILSIRIPVYLFKSEHCSKAKSRVRSYKGIFLDILEKEDRIQTEFDLKNNTSIIMGISKVTNSNFKILIESFYDSDTCFIISGSDSEIFSQEFVLDMFKNKINCSEMISINYLSLISAYCRDGDDMILRAGGDGGDQEISLQIFGYKNTIENEIIRISSCS